MLRSVTYGFEKEKEATYPLIRSVASDNKTAVMLRREECSLE